MLAGFVIAWIFFALTLAASLAAGLWFTRPRKGDREPPVDWDRFMRDLERWSAGRSHGRSG